MFLSTKLFSESIDIAYYYNNLDKAAQKFIENKDDLPKFLKNNIDKQKIRFDIQKIDGNFYQLILEKKEETYQFSKENLEEYTLKIKAKEEKINQLINSQDMVNDLSKAIKEKEVFLEAKGFFNKLKINTSKFFLKIASWFT
ncbi:MAG: hypothetical protein WCY27_03185 [archaeon]|jgi:hypothetical protein|nr:hypothetical protein [archaeon]MDD2477525.1 hypothetical protein [Candidatus ainarchaeum sp.]MDD3084824.1 hypothetical protein [Candidatus ainarchaeum sp.]MDD4221388.1 hypothetical protein [Candidatus ainarchaeum sp.]MDD4662372.1 hypothetical protein [Candidatus ainarchaeum sp.]